MATITTAFVTSTATMALDNWGVVIMMSIFSIIELASRAFLVGAGRASAAHTSDASHASHAAIASDASHAGLGHGPLAIVVLVSVAVVLSWLAMFSIVALSIAVVITIVVFALVVTATTSSAAAVPT